jgi:biopolymer transport protein ExbD
VGAKVGVSKGAVSDLNLTPLIDIVLVVLIIMMVNIPIQIREMGVKLPSSEVKPDQKEPPADQLVVAVYEDGRLALNRRIMTEDVMFYEITRRLKPMAHKNVFVDAHEAVPYGRVVDLVDLAREAGAALVGMAKMKPEGPPEPTSVAPGSMPRGVTLGSPKVFGGIEEAAAYEAIRPLQGSLEACFLGRLAAVPDLSGRLQIKTVVGPQGEHMEPPALGDGGTVEDADLKACVEALLPSIRTGPLGEGKTAVVLYPVLFSPG